MNKSKWFQTLKAVATVLLLVLAKPAVSKAQAALSTGGIILPPPAKIILPDPEMYSELANFEATWCAPNEALIQVGGVSVGADTVCFGKAVFKETQPVRSVALKSSKGWSELYIEAQWPSVELKTLSFEIVGPVDQSTTQQAKLQEIGKLQLQIDESGEVVSVSGQTPRHGFFKAQSQRGF